MRATVETSCEPMEVVENSGANPGVNPAVNPAVEPNSVARLELKKVANLNKAEVAV